jgi:Pyrimidine dimer DNA glycosylase
MRLWTLHPRYLDPQGLVAAWREGLLAQKVLAGRTRGYRHHPQLARFYAQADPLAAIAAFLAGIADEATARNYKFNTAKISRRKFKGQISETDGQLFYEWKHLRKKLRARSPRQFREIQKIKAPEPHPLFQIVPGEIREWERAQG